MITILNQEWKNEPNIIWFSDAQVIKLAFLTNGYTV